MKRYEQSFGASAGLSILAVWLRSVGSIEWSALAFFWAGVLFIGGTVAYLVDGGR